MIDRLTTHPRRASTDTVVFSSWTAMLPMLPTDGLCVCACVCAHKSFAPAKVSQPLPSAVFSMVILCELSRGSGRAACFVGGADELNRIVGPTVCD